MPSKRKWKVSVDKGGPNGDWSVKVYYISRYGRTVVKRIVRREPTKEKNHASNVSAAV